MAREVITDRLGRRAVWEVSDDGSRAALIGYEGQEQYGPPANFLPGMAGATTAAPPSLDKLKDWLNNAMAKLKTLINAYPWLVAAFAGLLLLLSGGRGGGVVVVAN